MYGLIDDIFSITMRLHEKLQKHHTTFLEHHSSHHTSPRLYYF